MSGYGGEFPDIGYGAEITAETPDGTSDTTPVLMGELFKLAIAADTASDSSGYKAVACAAGDDPSEVYLIQAKARSNTVGPLAFKLLAGGMAQVRNLPYTVAPTIGQSVEIAAANVRKVIGITHGKGKGLVLKVNTALGTAEVLL